MNLSYARMYSIFYYFCAKTNNTFMKKLSILTFCLLLSLVCFSQQEPQQLSKFDVSRLEFGGNFGLSFGNYTTSVIIAPQVGYVFNPRFSAGAGVNYSYYRYSLDSYNKSSLNYMGFNVYGRVKPVNPVVLQVQPEVYRVWGSSYGSSVSRLVSTLLVGGGIIVPIGNRAGISMMLYYDLIQDNYSPYKDRIIYSVGYTVTF
jgi:hypothetical protein